jgi:hypothetical protein
MPSWRGDELKGITEYKDKKAFKSLMFIPSFMKVTHFTQNLFDKDIYIHIHTQRGIVMPYQYSVI